MDATATPILELRNVEKSFLSGLECVEVLRGVSLAIHEGESISIRGESGSGKTTLINIAAGLESVSSGELFWNGEKVTAMTLDFLTARRRSFLGLVFQSYYLIPELNALENVLMPLRLDGTLSNADRERAHDLLKRVGLSHRITAMPATLSGGERQRVAVARALVNRPKVVLADEPTGNLDEKSADNIVYMLLETCRSENAALVLVTHSPHFAQLTTRQLHLQEGRL